MTFLPGSARRSVKTLWHSSEVWSFASMGTRFLGTALLLALISRKLPSEELGLWGVFVALTSLFNQLDMGFSQNVTRATGFAWAGATHLLPFGVAEVEPEKKGKSDPNWRLLADLVATLGQYYRWVGLCAFVLGLTAGGWWIAEKTVTLANASSLRVAWYVYSAGLLVNFWGCYWIALLNGINRVRHTQQTVLAGQLANYAIGIGGLLLGYGVWSLVAGSLVMGLVTRLSARALFRQLTAQGLPQHGRVDWGLIKVLWPNAWRMGAVSLGAYLILQANTLIGSAQLELNAMGMYTLSLIAVTMLTQISAVWVQVKLPLINVLRTHNDTATVAVLFADRVRLYLATYVVGAVGLWFVGPELLKLIGSKTTLLPAGPLFLMLAIYLAEMHHGHFASLVLSGNRNPFLAPALVSGAAIVAASVLLTPRFGFMGMLVAQGLVQLSFNNWWVVRRGLQSLGHDRRTYWRRFFGLPRNLRPIQNN